MRRSVSQMRNRLPSTLRTLIEIARTGNTAKRLWQIVFSRDDTEQAQVFGSLGYMARPAGRGARAVVIRAGNGTVSAVIALQDPKARVIELAEDERALYNDATQIVLRESGTIELGGNRVGIAREGDAVQIDVLPGQIVVDTRTGANTSKLTLNGVITTSSIRVVTE